MDRHECSALVAFGRDLPAPDARAASREESGGLAAGRETFRNVGCAACHAPKLGDLEGLYSDLLLHDMGDDLGDTGGYGVFTPESPGFRKPTTPGAGDPLAQSPTRREWRTPPLWGIRDSGPY